MPWCRQRVGSGSCRCAKAHFRTLCNACHRMIEEDECIVKTSEMWVHSVCGREEKEGMDAVFCKMVARSDVEYVRVNKKRERGGAQRQLEFGTGGESSSSGVGDREEGGQYSVTLKVRRSGTEKSPTEEQRRILEYVAKAGEVIRINSCAGSGKTTMAAMLSEELTRRAPSCQIAYFVFGRGNMEDARVGGKFGKNVHISTTHSFAKKHSCLNFDPESSLDFLAVSSVLDIPGSVRRMMPGESDAVVEIACGFATKIVISTVTRFCQSTAKVVSMKHIHPSAWPVPGMVGKKFREVLAVQGGLFYVKSARTLWNALDDGEVIPTHDVYLKQFQLSRFRIGAVEDRAPRCPKCDVDMVQRVGAGGCIFHSCRNFPSCLEKVAFLGFDVIIVDEAQDFTPCQWAAFIEQQAGSKCVIYVLGDNRQRMYTWRGVLDEFERAAAGCEFYLTNSFRFGRVIGEIATLILQHSNSDVIVRGIAKADGEVTRVPESVCSMAKVVLALTNKGLVRELLCRRKGLQRWPQWALVDEEAGSVFDLESYADLGGFFNGEVTSFSWNGETFTAWSALKEAATLGEEKGISSLMGVLEEYGGDVDFLRDAACSRQKRWRGPSGQIAASVELLLVTAHKAKGMEFMSVMLSTDFESRLPLFGDGLMPKREMNASVVEELNILYVAVTRARQVLQVPDRVFEYFQLLRSMALSEDCKVLSEEEWLEHRDNLVASWDEFIARFNSRTLVSLSDIPIPSRELFVACDASAEVLRDFAKWMYRMYHEDKFFSRYTAAVNEMGPIREELTTWFQLARGLMDQGTHEDI